MIKALLRLLSVVPRFETRAFQAVTTVACLLLCREDALSQGCVIARGAGASLILQGEGYLHPGDFQASLAYRWLHSDRHFVGSEEQKHRHREGTEVINDQHFFDVTLTYAATRRVWLNLTVPFVHSDRSSLYEHKGNASGERYHTQAGGLADVRLTSTVWLFDPEKAPTGNWALGVGVKAPTGDYKATDLFIRPEGPTLRYVDSSIQPGDGGWGVVLDTQAFLQIVKNTFAYLNGSYLINPRELVPETGYSVADSYLLRAGLSYALWPSKGLTLSFGGRLEGVPVEDWFGENEGFRRPGYTVRRAPKVTVTRRWGGRGPVAPKRVLPFSSPLGNEGSRGSRAIRPPSLPLGGCVEVAQGAWEFKSPNGGGPRFVSSDVRLPGPTGRD